MQQVVRHPALRAIASEEPWTPPHADLAVREGAGIAVAADARITGFTLATADPDARGAGHDLVIQLRLEPGLSPEALDSLLTELGARIAQSRLLTERVDNLLVQLMPLRTSN
jgi:hypothetical protein